MTISGTLALGIRNEEPASWQYPPRWRSLHLSTSIVVRCTFRSWIQYRNQKLHGSVFGLFRRVGWSPVASGMAHPNDGSSASRTRSPRKRMAGRTGARPRLGVPGTCLHGRNRDQPISVPPRR
ncbi:hypothetical protein I603_0300 [Erythrobacter dokdonensis DSW-74]|uniref:Uncharacterized protein n=1 Tax=Erythrobacter dokdonensis DSW-74 TaxID=1300349 RepID=A0A1A7BI65_9SPHN|nr:hypothetical protein I603_0300 [Erythrobacter dokdonensis DSW-74]